MNKIKTIRIIIAMFTSVLVYCFSDLSGLCCTEFKSTDYKNTDTTDGGIRNPGGGDNPYPGR